MNKPFVSFIIPVYNVESYLTRCVQSVQNQPVHDWEMILVDDGSSDRSGAVCDELAVSDSRIRVVHQENKGVAAARNKGLEQAVGEWIWFVDSDDYICPNALAQLKESVESFPCDTVFFGFLHDWDGVVTPEEEDRRAIHGLSKEEFLSQVFCYANPSMLFSRVIFEEHGIRFTQGIRMAEDLEVQYKYLAFSKKQLQLADHLYVYCHREGSAMMNADSHKNNVNDCLCVANNLLDFAQIHGVVTENWFVSRIRLLLKSGIQSAALILSEQLDGVQQKFRDTLAAYAKAGCTTLADKTLKLAAFHLKLYFIALRIFYKLRK